MYSSMRKKHSCKEAPAQFLPLEALMCFPLLLESLLNSCHVTWNQLAALLRLYDSIYLSLEKAGVHALGSWAKPCPISQVTIPTFFCADLPNPCTTGCSSGEFGKVAGISACCMGNSGHQLCWVDIKPCTSLYFTLFVRWDCVISLYNLSRSKCCRLAANFLVY